MKKCSPQPVLGLPAGFDRGWNSFHRYYTHLKLYATDTASWPQSDTNFQVSFFIKISSPYFPRFITVRNVVATR